MSAQPVSTNEQQRPDFWADNDAWWDDLPERNPPPTDHDERKPDCWQRISEPLWRSLKKSIVKAGQVGAISGPAAEGLLGRFNLRNL